MVNPVIDINAEVNDAESQFASLVNKEVLRMRVRQEAKRVLELEALGAIEMPPILELADLLAQPRSEQHWCIDGLLPVGGRALLAAQYKAGKTTLTANLVKSLADGVPFLGRFNVTPPGNIMVLDFEMTDDKLNEWYADMRIQNVDRVKLRPMRGAGALFDLQSPEVRKRLAAELRDKQIAFLIFDCLRPVLDALGLDEHSECGLILTAFDALLNEADIKSAVVVHHAGHANERSRGDSRLRDWPDAEWLLVRQNDNPDSPRFFKAFGRDVEVPESRLFFDKGTRQLRIDVGSNRSKAQVEDASKSIWDYLGVHGAQSTNRIEESMQERGITKTAVGKALTTGLESGLFIRSERKGKGGGWDWSQGESFEERLRRSIPLDAV